MDELKNSSAEMFTAAFTVVTPNYLSHAYTVKKSFLQYNPEALFFICLIGEAKNCYKTPDKHFCFISELKDSSVEGMLSRYTPFELSCALKPFFAYHLFEKYPGIRRLIYLDGDMLVFGEFNPLSNAAIILSPHRTKYVNYLQGYDNYSVIAMNRYGVYNEGYFELNRKEEAISFLIWWKNLNETLAKNQPDKHLFTDQLWLNLTHSFFNDVYVNKHPGYNVAFWNLIEREIVKKDDVFLVNGQPLALFHFARYKPEFPDEMVDHKEPFLTFTRHPLLKKLFEKYRNSLLNMGYEKIIQLPYPYGQPAAPSSFWKKIFRGKKDK